MTAEKLTQAQPRQRLTARSCWSICAVACSTFSFSCAAKHPPEVRYELDFREYGLPAMLNGRPDEGARELVLRKYEDTQISSSSRQYGNVNVQTTTRAHRHTELEPIKQLRAETRRSDESFFISSIKFDHFISQFLIYSVAATHATKELLITGRMNGGQPHDSQE